MHMKTLLLASLTSPLAAVLIFGVGSLAASTPYLAAILGLIVFSWFKSASSLSVQFEEAMSKGTEEEVVDAQVLE